MFNDHYGEAAEGLLKQDVHGHFLLFVDRVRATILDAMIPSVAGQIDFDLDQDGEVVADRLCPGLLDIYHGSSSISCCEKKHRSLL